MRLFRLIPVTIVLYRYLMVCHVEFCITIGGKVLSRKLIQWTFVVPVSLSVLALFFNDVLRDNLICNGREEVTWYNLENFFGKTEGGKIQRMKPFTLFPLVRWKPCSSSFLPPFQDYNPGLWLCLRFPGSCWICQDLHIPQQAWSKPPG